MRSMHATGNLMLRDGYNVEKAQSVLQKALLVDASTLGAPSREIAINAQEIGEMLKASVARGEVINVSQKRFKCPCCSKVFRKKSVMHQHALNDCTELKE